MHEFSHLNAKGEANMVNIAAKNSTQRTATAKVDVMVGQAVGTAIAAGKITKGNVFATARIAGIQAAKRTWELIPLCHHILIDSIKVNIELNHTQDCVHIQASAYCYGKTGVEMEALTAASVSALTIYDMCKSLDKGIRIEHLQLVHKSGGKTGTWDAKKT